MKKTVFVLAFFLALFASLCVLADEAVEVTESCRITCGTGKNSLNKCRDRSVRTAWSGGSGRGAYLEITLPEGTEAAYVYLQWYENAYPWQIQVERNGEWQTQDVSPHSYYNDTLALSEPSSHFRVLPLETGREVRVAEIHVYTPGSLPAWVQIWQPTVEKADLMLVACHPDDEILWFGGALATYAGQMKMDVLVCVLVPAMPYRRIELLDCLWTSGVRTYPVWGGMPDKYSGSLKSQYQLWNETRLQKLFTSWYRQYKPDVVLTHDKGGEYGHGGHKVCADLCVKALKWAADENKFPESAKLYGTWDVLKLYLHLYPENVIEMKWDTPLSAFGGRTGLEVAKESFNCHQSQLGGRYAVRDTGNVPCTLFGLYRSLVGEDRFKDDFFENISYEVREDPEE